MTVHPYLYAGLKSIPKDNPWEYWQPNELINRSCELFGLDKSKIRQRNRKRGYVYLRKMLCNIFDKHYAMGRSETAELFVEFDHASVIYAINTHQDKYKYDDVYRENYNSLVDYIENGKPFILKEYEEVIMERMITWAEVYAILRIIQVGEKFTVSEDEYLKVNSLISKSTTTEYGKYNKIKFKVTKDGKNHIFTRIE